jgi:hypothetical protein
MNQSEELNYSSSLWRKKRKEILDKTPMCQCCACLGLQNPAKHVHHVIKFGKQMNTETHN